MEREERYGRGEVPKPAEYRLPKRALEKWGQPEEVKTDYVMEGATAAKGAYVGINRPVDSVSGSDCYTLEGELAKGRKLVRWDGVYVSFPFCLVFPSADSYFYPSSPTTLIDKKRRMLAMLVGHPKDGRWMEDVIEPVEKMFDEIRVKGDSSNGWSTKQQDARRGDFVSLTTGVSYGGGQQVRSLFSFALLWPWLIHLLYVPSDQETLSMKGYGRSHS